jgi:hypothetical protein
MVTAVMATRDPTANGQALSQVQGGRTKFTTPYCEANIHFHNAPTTRPGASSRQQQAAQEMRAGEGLGEEQRGQKPQRYLAHDIDAHEYQRVHEHFAERGIGDDFAEIIQPDEGTQKLSQVAERDLLETHRDVVEDGKPDHRQQIEHRREQEEVQQRRSCVRHRDRAGGTDEARPALWRGPRLALCLQGLLGQDRLDLLRRFLHRLRRRLGAGERLLIAIWIGRDRSGHCGCGPRWIAY